MVSLMPAYIKPLYGCKDPEHTCHLAFVLHKNPMENVNLLFNAYIILLRYERQAAHGLATADGHKRSNLEL